MAQVGLYIDREGTSLSPALCNQIAEMVQAIPDIAFSLVEENLLVPEALGRMADQLKNRGVDRALLIGGSPKRYEASFNKFGYPTPLNPYLITVINTKSLLGREVKEEEALERIRRAVKRGLFLQSVSHPIQRESLPVKPEVLVIGGGASGLTVALALVRSGLNVHLIEKKDRLGGKASNLRFSYYQSGKAGPWLEGLIAEVSHHPRITLHLESELKRVEGHFGRFQVKIQGKDKTDQTLPCSAIVVATGYHLQSNRTGIFAHRSFVSPDEMERLLAESEPPTFYWNGKKAESATFVLDQTNTDLKLDAIHMMKQALLLQETFQCQTTILCKEVKVSADGMERLYRRARQQGALFVKYSDPPKFSIVNGRIRVDVKDTSSIRREEEPSLSILSDLVVMSQPILPNEETELLSKRLGLSLGDRGFLMEDNPQLLRVRSNRRGIVVVGGCRFPQELSETLIEAEAAAQEVIKLLAAGRYEYDLAVAEVDPKKCAVCYTCPRLCPHSAITVEKYAERNVYLTPGLGEGLKWGAAKVDPVACYGCGICVGECPAKAITLRHVTEEQIYTQMGFVEGVR